MKLVCAILPALCRAALLAAWVAGPVQAGTERLTLPEAATGTVSVAAGDVKHPPARPKMLLSVFVGPVSRCCDGRSPVSGTYRFEGGVLSFKPAFPFIEGQPYTVLSSAGGKTEFSITPDTHYSAPKVVAVYPSGHKVPENTLRFYIEFSTPMQPHRSDEFITLRNVRGEADMSAFMSFEQELWNEDRTRLTLLMDPGRIKRGVATNLELGPALEAGERHSIYIKAGWPGALGAQTAIAFTADFEVGPPLRTRPDPSLWQIKAPQADSRDPLHIMFDRPFDRVQLRHSIEVFDADGEKLYGEIDILPQEMAWRFTSDTPWSGDHITLVIDARLEDVAGNNLRETLDHAVGAQALNLNEVTMTVTLKPDID